MITALKTFCVFVIFLSLSADATFSRGSWKLTDNDDGRARASGEKVTSQKARELGARGDGVNIA